MMQRFIYTSKISGAPKLFVSTQVWKIQVEIPYEISKKNKKVNEKTQKWKICQVLN
jgi:hypothetical protein